MRFVFLGLFFFVLSPASSFAGSVDMRPAAKAVLELFKTNDVVVLGEIHHVHEQRSLLTRIAEENGKLRAFDALATEALWTVDQEKLDRYLATGDEKEIFLEEGWFNSVNIREAFRQLRANKDKVCTVDIDFYTPDNPKRVAEFKERWASFPEAVRKLILRQEKAKSVEELLKNETLMDREYLMGVAIGGCLKAHRKVLVHLGSDHVSSLDPVYLKQAAAQPWDTVQWLAYSNPGVKFAAVKNMIDVADDLDDAGKALVAFYKAKGAANPVMLASKDLPANIKKLMTSDGIEAWRRSDYVIVGPAGTAEKKVKPVR